MIPNKINRFREPLESGSSFYCMYSGLVHISEPFYGINSNIIVPNRQATFEHELTHWQMHATTSTGYFISYLHGIRWMAVNYVSNRGISIRPLFEFDEQRVRLPLQETLSPLMWENRWGIAFMIEKMFMHFSASEAFQHKKEGSSFIRRESIVDDVELNPMLQLCWSLQDANNMGEGVVKKTDPQLLLQMFKQMSVDAVTIRHKEMPMNTIWLMESYSSIIEIIKYKEMGVSQQTVKKFNELLGHKYFMPVRYFFGVNKIELNIDSLLKLAPLLMLAIEVSLDPPIPPKYVLHVDNVKWNIIYPPARYDLIVRYIRQMGMVYNRDLQSENVDINLYATSRKLFYEIMSKNRKYKIIKDRKNELDFRKFIEKNALTGERIEDAALFLDFSVLFIITGSYFRDLLLMNGFETISEAHYFRDNRNLNHLKLSKSLWVPPVLITHDGNIKINGSFSDYYLVQYIKLGLESYIQDDYAIGSGKKIEVSSFATHNLNIKEKSWYKEFKDKVNNGLSTGRIFPHCEMDRIL